MSNAFPTSHTTSTTTKVTPLIWFDKSYVQTTAGLLKATVIAVDLISFIIAQFGHGSTGRVAFFSFTSMTGFWVSLILFALYSFHVVEKLHFWPWLLGEFVFCLVWATFFCVASLLMVIDGGLHSMAGMLGFVAFGIYAYDGYIKYHLYTSGAIAQGERTTAQSPA